MYLRNFESQNGHAIWRQKIGTNRALSCKQQEGQSLAVYLAELRKLAVTCGWTEKQLAENLRDKFVMGLHKL